jgi:predicted DNA binding protein
MWETVTETVQIKKNTRSVLTLIKRKWEITRNKTILNEIHITSGKRYEVSQRLTTDLPPWKRRFEDHTAVLTACRHNSTNITWYLTDMLNEMIDREERYGGESRWDSVSNLSVSTYISDVKSISHMRAAAVRAR